MSNDVTRLLPDGTTTCCGAYTSISVDDGVEYCKACFEGVVEYLTEEPPARTVVRLG